MKCATKLMTPDDPVFKEGWTTYIKPGIAWLPVVEDEDEESSELWAMRNIGPIGVACQIGNVLYTSVWTYKDGQVTCETTALER